MVSREYLVVEQRSPRNISEYMKMTLVKAILLALAMGHVAQAQLNTAAKAAGLLYFGTAVDNPDLSDSKYIANLETADFGQITPANAMKVSGQTSLLYTTS
jgi:hypothetical protein